MARATRWQQEVGARWNRLTQRQREALRLAAQGRRNREIATMLGIRPKTVGNHLRRKNALLAIKK
ncbi:MAG: response regulator transcription factor [Thermoflexales bacterium]|nr:response regulator transcription factor [Thermoflexales bacterium]